MYKVYIPDGPSLADPTHTIAYADGEGKQFSTFKPLEELLERLKYKRAFQDGRQAGLQEARDVLGVSFEDYITAVRAQESK